MLFVLLLCINHNCYLYMSSWGPDLVNKLITISISMYSVYDVTRDVGDTLHIINVEKNVSRLLFHFFPSLFVFAYRVFG